MSRSVPGHHDACVPRCASYPTARHFHDGIALTPDDRLAAVAAAGLVGIDDGFLRVTEAGGPVLRSGCAVFDRYLGSGPGRYWRAL